MDSIFFHRHFEETVLPDGILKGLKIAIQPNISVAGWPTEAGSGALTGFRALEDATLYRLIREAGAYVCGSTRMSEFGFGLTGSRAGKALISQEADVELVLDMTGESRLAAAGASVCGLKPSWGLVSHLGLIGLIPSMECCGIISENINNIRIILKSVAGPDERDFSMPDEEIPDFEPKGVDPAKIAVGILTEVQDALPSTEQNLFRREVDDLKKQGIPIRELSLPDFPLFMAVHQVVGSVEASSAAGRYDSVRYGRRAPGSKNWNEMYLASRGAAFGPLLKSYLFQGAYFQFQNYRAYEDACRLRARLCQQMEKLFTETDFLLFPAFRRGLSEKSLSLADTYAQFAETAFANVAGCPAFYIPPVAEERVGIQLAGPRRSDGRLLNFGEYTQNLRRGGH